MARADGGSGNVPVVLASAACVGTTLIVLRPRLRSDRQWTVQALSKVSLAAISVGFIYRWCMRLWIIGKLSNSTVSLEEWKEQWVQCESASSSSNGDARTQKLIEFARKQNPKISFWQSEGELRFLVLKRAMDLLYASVGTALEVTKPNRPSKEGPSWQTSLAAMAAASYFSVIGPNKRAAQAVNEASSELIQNAWGMVSLPAIKLLSLRATRLLKGAALAERIIIDGVPCFILCKDPCPDVIVALKRFARQERRRRICSRLSTIDEGDTGRRQRSNSVTLRQRHVIFHLTGGGFFAHTLASDLPYLLDWSKTTGAIVICPEYSLLPEHTFPVALDEITHVYRALFNGNASLQLGFDVKRIVVTGESAGGNLAAAMCVKLGMSMPHTHRSTSTTTTSGEYAGQEDADQVRLPNALMLSCPALNLSLELSPSRVIGDKDPVLPSGLISAISDAYAPVSKKDPLVSPLYASDESLRKFPPTLIYCSSDDPLLDDSVHFNTRLRINGVESDLRATHHMPHAYWGLGTAGFPEAQQVQLECAEFLREKLEQY
jgi:epsilon-lactone hydrolase